MSHYLLKIAVLASAALATQVQAHSVFEVEIKHQGEYYAYDGNQPHNSTQLGREELNRERQRMHRSFDARMRELDQRNREIDRWQSSHRNDHQRIAHMANEQRAQLNRERDRLNRERDQMNRYYDELNRELDRRNQQLSHYQHQDRHHHDQHDRHHHKRDRQQGRWH